ncbi:MAG TPA: DUF3592 domain-containing protein [Pseudonocardiaceae bacterium]|jgi:hypothetical protein|nr:DUF3592 domain-containing protein [Pseudonocardiaceae bacterium]
MTAVVTGPVAGVTRPVPGRHRRAVWWVPLATAGVLTALITMALAGAALDDAGIDARTGHATAEVLAVTSMRTLVQFAAPGGKVYRPDQGVAYPSQLQVGQLVRVEYDRADPDQVRVAGRTWVRGVAPAVITLAVLWSVLGPATWWLRRRHRHGARA